jgi:subtilisin family serine protease
MYRALLTAVALALLTLARPGHAVEISSQIVVGLARPDPGAVAQPSRLAARLEGLGLTFTRTLAGGLPVARRLGARAGTNAFEIDPERVWLLEAPDSAAAAAAVAALVDDPAIAWVEPNRVREVALAAATVTLPPGFPSDPLFRDTRQWGLRNAGPLGAYGGVAGADIGALAAWSACTGSSALRLAIADTGIDPAHPELALALPGGASRIEYALNVTSEPGGSVADSAAHGTMVAGVMAARSGEGAHFDSLGIAGVCGGDGGSNPGCRIVPIKIAPGHSSLASSFDIARAILYATDLGARAVNLSFAGSGGSAVERGALYYAVTRGTIVVAASGNRGSAAPQYPAAYAADGLCIQVGASDESDRRVAFSSYGPGLDVLAPGVDVWTTFMTYPAASGLRLNGYTAAAGTSFAAPFVTGTVGLLAVLRPELSDTDFQHLIRESAHDLGAPGLDAETGWGRLDAGAALGGMTPELGVWHDEVAGGRLTLLGGDSLWVSESGPGTMSLLRGMHRAELYAVETTVTLPDSFRGPVRVWPRVGGTFTVRAGFNLLYWAPWCEVVETHSGGFTLRGYLYRVRDQELPAGSEDPWLPVPPDQARFGFTVIGPVERAPALGVPPRDAGATAPALIAWPNPFTEGVRFAVPGAHAADAHVTVSDLAGRIVVRLAGARAGGEVVWDGRDARGMPVSPGLYLARCEAAGQASCCKLVKLDRRR